MYIEKVKNNGKDYLRLVSNKRIINSKGIKTSTKIVEYNIGPLSKFDDGQPNYVDRLKESFKNGNPIIEVLLPFVDKHTPLIKKYNLSFTEMDDFCIGNPKLFSHILIERILEEIGIVSFVRRYKQFLNSNFDVLGFVRLLIYGRVLNPASKIKTAKQNTDYYDPIISNIYEYNIYDTLDFIYKYRNNITKKINSKMIEKFNRKANLVFYDVTNFYFEIDAPDTDKLLDNGTVLEKGIRKNGVSKEERSLPIVQMGMFMDENGFPISIEMFPGNTLDHLTVKDSLINQIDTLNYSRFIFVGDRGMCNYINLLHLLHKGNGYVISKSIAKSTKEEKEWILKQSDYTNISESFKYKSRIITKTVKDENNKKVQITEKEVIYWSKSYYEKQKHENKSFLEFIEKLKTNPESFRITKTQASSLKKFIKKEFINELTGEVIDSNKLKAIIDEDKVNAFVAYFGYYKLITSELDMNDCDVIDTYHGLSQIEDQFRVMKSTLNTRPINVWTKEHIQAHLLICMIALIIIRIIQYKIKNSKDFISNQELDWESGLSSERIVNALNKWTVDRLPEDYYRFNSLNDEDLSIILKSFNIDIPKKLYRRADLKNIKMNIQI